MPRRPEPLEPPDDAPSRRVAADRQPTAGWSAADSLALADRPAPRPGKDLQQRLGRLPEWHPSSPEWDQRKPPELPPGADDGWPDDGPRLRPEPLTDAEHADRVQHIRAQLADARDRGLATDERFIDPADNRWTIERQVIHRQLADSLYASAAEVPCERKAIMVGGLGGAGKSSVLEEHAGIDRSRYLTVNPDDIKEEMARRGLVPELEGLSPMEASDLVHAESSHVAKRLARRAMDDGKNVIWDITMSKTSTTGQRLDDLERAGYSTRGIFVDISVGEAVRRADARHRSGHEDFRAGIGFGGRYVPPEVIEAQADPDWGSRNRRVFEQAKTRFTEWAVYDNSVTGRDPELIQAGQGSRREEER